MLLPTWYRGNASRAFWLGYILLMLGSSLFRTDFALATLIFTWVIARNCLPQVWSPSKHIEEGMVFNFCRGLQRITRIKPQFVHCYNGHIAFTGNYVNTNYRAHSHISHLQEISTYSGHVCNNEKAKTVVLKRPKADHTLSPVLGSECMYLNRLSIRLSYLLEPRQSKVKLATVIELQRTS